MTKSIQVSQNLNNEMTISNKECVIIYEDEKSDEFYIKFWHNFIIISMHEKSTIYGVKKVIKFTPNFDTIL
jgi:hypothetical protein